MNQALALSAATTEFPSSVAYSVTREGASLCSFNCGGNLVGVGTFDGSVLVLDLDTKSIARDTVAHVGPVSSLCWLAAHHLLSASKDWNAILWNVADPGNPVKDRVVRFSSPVLVATAHPHCTKNKFRIVACCLNQYPWLINLDRAPNGSLMEEKVGLIQLDDGDMDLTKSAEYIQTTTVGFDQSGNYIFLGNAKGIVTVIENETRKVLFHFRPSGTAAIRGFQFSNDNVLIAINSADKTLRCYLLENIMSREHDQTTHQTVEPDFKYFDSIDQNRWIQCVFSPNSKYFIGGSAVKNSHKIYIWEQETCGLAKILEIQKDTLLDVAWHPTLPILISISGVGVINVWTVRIQENWSAFAPDFRELDENAEYEELEDEFDVVEGSEKRHQQINMTRNEDELIDIMS
ncbi:WD40-repeat-containing domain protein [Chytriomyces sp. MP71]|nr:WD40-repeat-containing domain protein [Chytriomyces sp. MP71]